MNNDLVKTLDKLAAGATLTTQANRVLKAAQPVPAIPARVGVVTQTRGTAA